MSTQLGVNQIQPLDDPVRREADQTARRIQKDIEAALLALSVAATAVISEVSLLIVRVQFSNIMQLLVEPLQEELKIVYNDLTDLYNKVGQMTMNEVVRGQAFDTLDPQTLQALQEARALLLANISDTVRLTVANTIAAGLQAGQAAEKIAENIAQTIGLTVQQAQAVLNYQRMLEAGDVTGALARELRDRRYDAATAQAGTQPMAPAKAAAAVRRYAERMRAYRSETISITQSAAAGAEGRRQAWRQLIARGVVDTDTIRRFWLTAADELVCPNCSAIPSWNPDGIPMTAQYKTPIGLVDGPTLHPRCRCSERIEGTVNPGYEEAENG